MLANWIKPRSTELVGVDIGTQEIKAVLLSQSPHGYQLEAIARIPLEKGVVVDREIKNSSAVAEAMKQVRAQLPRKARFGAASVSGSTVMTKVIFMDANLSDEELEAQIEIEADNLIPYPLEDVNIDFEPLEVNEATSKVSVLLAACRSDNVESRVEALEAAGLGSKVVDVEGYALGRSFKLLAPQLPCGGATEVVAMVDMGASMTTFAIIAEGETAFIREQAFGGEQYTQTIQSYYGMTGEEAERAKIAGELPHNFAIEVLEPFQAQFVQQIRRTIQIFCNASKHKHIDRLILCGGAVQIEGLCERLSTELEIPVQRADPFGGALHASEMLRQSVAGDIGRYMVACGLALRSFESWHI
ncbi:pilus assembly protein PilM [Ferrimonas marina]|uniref:Type IV pilus assembly protein PilM n=1 Tax=Ferrimonas marina TaxID=299255 RepID=A0A1M5XHL5_9GAMM|nr:pilus assembly protein PilM [Ferrimonas marina]SHH99038.1 type IV pilus assembly protein PilM [Ferrimonas marina]